MFSIVVQKIYKSVNQWIFYNTLLPQVPILIAPMFAKLAFKIKNQLFCKHKVIKDESQPMAK